MRRKSERFTVQTVRFLAPQNGEPEEDLKEALRRFFRRDRSVIRAYLTLADFGDGTSQTVCLCLTTEFGPDPGLTQKVLNIFAQMFSYDQHLDILFLDLARELELRRICSPFFERRANNVEARDIHFLAFAIGSSGPTLLERKDSVAHKH